MSDEFPNVPGRGLPAQLSVLPVFFVPTDAPPPVPERIARLRQHLEWSQRRYAELLPLGSTFSIAERTPLICLGAQARSFYSRLMHGAAPRIFAEVLLALRDDARSCPYVLLTIVMNQDADQPTACGSPFNGGHNNGAGGCIVSSKHMDAPNFQSTLQHELGHAFGLCHIGDYEQTSRQAEQAMRFSPSIMSYNETHHTTEMTSARSPGVFVAEDILGLAMNRRAFPSMPEPPDEAAGGRPILSLSALSLPVID